MVQIDITEKQINNFIDSMNHRMTSIEEKAGKIEIDVKWMKRVGYYMAGVITAIGLKFIVGA
jgi:sporulation protein YlmC with PRC-barrel domain